METNNKKTADNTAAGTEQVATYESLMAELSVVMKTMENSAASLEEQLASYEKGMKLCADLETMLKSAEERISIINKTGAEERFE